MAKHTKVVDIFGDKLSVYYDGNVWVSPHNMQQHSSAEDAMVAELDHYFVAGGDVLDDEELEEYLSRMTDESEELA